MPIGLEKYLIDPLRWEDDPSWSGNGPPIGLGKHPTKGWFVMCSGQGPFVAWSEWGHHGDPHDETAS